MASTLVSLGRKASQRQHGMKDTCLGPRHRGSQLEEQMRREVVSLELFWKMRTDQLLRRPEAFPLLLIWGPSKCCTTTQNVFSSFSFSTVYWKSDHVDGVNWPDCDSKMILFLLQKNTCGFRVLYRSQNDIVQVNWGQLQRPLCRPPPMPPPQCLCPFQVSIFWYWHWNRHNNKRRGQKKKRCTIICNR